MYEKCIFNLELNIKIKIKTKIKIIIFKKNIDNLINEY